MQPTVPDVSALVDRWVAQQIITAEQAERIRADLAASDTRAARPISLVAEGLGYLGGVIVLVGLLLVLGLTWETLAAGGKVAVAAGVTVAFARPAPGCAECSGSARRSAWPRRSASPPTNC
jgi:uncharacterized membrane protein